MTERQRPIVARARRLRKAMTPPELKLWFHLRRTGAGGHRFRRQHPFGPYVFDFYCERARLAVEVDGLAHEFGDGPDRDAARDRWVAERGVRTVRFNANEVLTNIDGVVRQIEAICNELPLRPSGPLPPEGEE